MLYVATGKPLDTPSNILDKVLFDYLDRTGVLLQTYLTLPST